eukprot:4643270-Heterocapsa_arctica.AAC.1
MGKTVAWASGEELIECPGRCPPVCEVVACRLGRGGAWDSLIGGLWVGRGGRDKRCALSVGSSHPFHGVVFVWVDLVG